MIMNAILLVFQGILNIILLPLSALNIAIDFVASIPVVVSFLQCVAYVVPWDNILPLIILTIAIFMFRIALSFIKLIIYIIPLW